jgi:exodeoxyribonuclease VII small subunit
LTFEQALKRLEEIVHLLEEGDMGLDGALAHYEEGVLLLRNAHVLLERAERRIELLTGVDAEGNPVTRPLEDVSTMSLEQGKNQSGGPSNRRSRRGSSPDEPS